jgi:hypothetical protein
VYSERQDAVFVALCLNSPSLSCDYFRHRYYAANAMNPAEAGLSALASFCFEVRARQWNENKNIVLATRASCALLGVEIAVS